MLQYKYFKILYCLISQSVVNIKWINGLTDEQYCPVGCKNNSF